LTVSQIAELSNLSKSYISQVKNGKRPPSKRLLLALTDYYYTTNKGRIIADAQKAIDLYLESRRNGLSPRTIHDFWNAPR
jgi:transcriptional regulator with XRE-family HTH domain